MKKTIFGAVLALGLTGCATAPYQPAAIYNNATVPGDAENGAVCVKRGTSEQMNVLGLFATGDAGIEAAKKSAGIMKVASVDTQYTSILGLFVKTTTIVCGE